MASAELTFERSLYIGNAFSSILYGVELVLCFQSIYFLTKQSPLGKKNLFYILFSLGLTTFSTINIVINFLFGQFMWIDHRDIPGGPPAFFAANNNAWFTTLGTSAVATGITMGDGLLLFRCYMIMGSKPWIVIFPGLMFLASTALAIVSTIASAAPSQFIFTGSPAQLGTAWVSLSVGYNGIVTTMITLKLLHAHQVFKSTLSREAITVYTGVIAILVESALPYTLLGIVFSVLYGRNNVASVALASIWGAFTTLSPQLIIMRVSMGIAWTKDTLVNSPMTDLRFQQPEISTFDQQNSDIPNNEPKLTYPSFNDSSATEFA